MIPMRDSIIKISITLASQYDFAYTLDLWSWILKLIVINVWISPYVTRGWRLRRSTIQSFGI